MSGTNEPVTAEVWRDWKKLYEQVIELRNLWRSRAEEAECKLQACLQTPSGQLYAEEIRKRLAVEAHFGEAMRVLRKVAIEPYETKHSRCRLCGSVWLYTHGAPVHDEGCVLAQPWAQAVEEKPISTESPPSVH